MEYIEKPTKSTFILKNIKRIALFVYSLFALFPLVWIFIVSFKSDVEVFTTVFRFTPVLTNYQAVLGSADYIKSFIDNIIVSGGAVLVSIVIGVPAAYAMARFSYKYRDDFAFTILSFKFAPEILVILPLFSIYQAIGLYDTYVGLIWVYQLISLPLLIWVLRGYFEDISIEVEQAAMLDGYNRFQIFAKILIPLVRPGLVASGLLAFIFAWNSFTFGLLLSGFSIQTITVAALKFVASDTLHYGQMAVAALVAIIPEIILAIIIQKHLVRGLSFGAVKG